MTREAAHDAAGGRESGLAACTLLSTSGYFREDGVLDIDGAERQTGGVFSASILEHLRGVSIMPLDDYNALAGTEYALSPGECLVWSSGKAYPVDSFSFDGGRALHVSGQLDTLPLRLPMQDAIVTNYYVIVPDWAAFSTEAMEIVERAHFELLQVCEFDLPGVSEAERKAIVSTMYSRVRQLTVEREPEQWIHTGYSLYDEKRNDFFYLYGSLFFLGIVLSVVFIAAAALIIYYKQLAEGYEDQSRFAIMRKVGMTKGEIRKTVNSQVLTVFYAPLLLSGVHLAFAFPFIQKITILLGVSNMPLLLLTNAVCFLAFALFYVFVYRATARAYYSIVSDGTGRA